MRVAGAAHNADALHVHPHDSHDSASRNQRRLLIALALAATYMVAEFIGGLLTGSLALLADAGHMLSDVFALAMSAAAIRIAQLPPTPQRTYGYQRMEIVAALGHIVTCGGDGEDARPPRGIDFLGLFPGRAKHIREIRPHFAVESIEVAGWARLKFPRRSPI